jgi:hypothetical protein
MEIEPRQKPVADHRFHDADACVADNAKARAAHTLPDKYPATAPTSRITIIVRWNNARDVV